MADCPLRVWDGLVSCHLCKAQVDVTQTRIVMADKAGRIPPAFKERLWRDRGVKPYQWVRLCLACNKKEGR